MEYLIATTTNLQPTFLPSIFPSFLPSLLTSLLPSFLPPSYPPSLLSSISPSQLLIKRYDHQLCTRIMFNTGLAVANRQMCFLTSWSIPLSGKD